jgi:superfamily II DNA or RNA helicase
MLRDQWVEQIEKSLNYTPGIIGGGSFDVDKHIVVGMIQTINNKAKELTKEFGLVIVDECHHLPASTFKATIDKMYARYKIGVSATLTRKDRKHIMLNDYLGIKVISPENFNTMTPIVKSIKTEFKLPAAKDWATKITKLMRDQEYQYFIQKLAEKKVMEGHKVLVVSDRVDFLHTLASRTGSTAIAAVSAGLTEKQKVRLRNYIEEHIYNELDIIYGSISIFKEGINLPPLSCLILATPINNDSMLTQLIGRVVRKYPNKKQPEVLDIVFNCRTGQSQYSNRLALYSDMSFEVKSL